MFDDIDAKFQENADVHRAKSLIKIQAVHPPLIRTTACQIQ